jgi:protein-disulfide isomerase
MKARLFLACAAIFAVAGLSAQPAAAATAKAHATPSKARDWSLVVSQTDAGGFVMGNPDAKVKLVEYGSMTCPHCARFDESAVPSLIAKYVKTGKVSWEFRNYVRDGFDVSATVVARCGGAKSFFPLTRAMFKDQAKWQKKITAASQDALNKAQDLPPNQEFLTLAKIAGFQQWAAAHGVPLKKTHQCLTDEQAMGQVVQMADDAKTQFPDFPGTPTFVVNGTMVEFGAITEAEVWPTVEAQLNSALEASQATSSTNGA